MDFLSSLFNFLLYKPLFNLLILFYQYLPGKDLGVAIITLTLFIKFLLYPLTLQAIKIQKSAQGLQLKIKEIQNKYKDDKEKQASEVLALYKKENINPFTGLFVSFVQVPVLIALWLVFSGGFGADKMANLYSFVSDPGFINMNFLGILDLASPSAQLAFLAGISQFFQAKTMMVSSGRGEKQVSETKQDLSKIMEKQMLYFFPFLSVIVLLKLPSVIALYWLTSSLFSVVQQKFVLKV